MKKYKITFTDKSSIVVLAKTDIGAMLKAKNRSQLPITCCIEIR